MANDYGATAIDSKTGASSHTGDVSPPGTEGFLVYEQVAAARERLAEVLGEDGEQQLVAEMRTDPSAEAG